MTEFETAWIQYRRSMIKVCMSVFKNKYNDGEMTYLMATTLDNCMKKYKPGRKAVFHTYLCSAMRNEALKEYYGKNKYRYKKTVYISHMADGDNIYTDREGHNSKIKNDVFIIMESLKSKNELYYNILHDRFIGEMSFREMGRKYNKSRQWAADQVRMALECCREICD